MPHDFDRKKRAYVTESGRVIPRPELRAKIDKLLDYTKRQAARIAERYDAGEITGEQLNEQMRSLLKDSHIVSSVVGRGGREQMTSSDWGRVGQKLRRQYEYLNGFQKRLQSGTLSKAASTSRAKSYISSVYISFAESRMVADKEGAAEQPSGKEMLCRLVQNSKEGCAECNADAGDGWVPVSEMKSIGERICEEFCLCEIEFEDEV